MSQFTFLCLLRTVFCSSSSPFLIPSDSLGRQQRKVVHSLKKRAQLFLLFLGFTCSFLPSHCDVSSPGCEVWRVPALPSSKQRARILSQFTSQGRSHNWPMLGVIQKSNVCSLACHRVFYYRLVNNMSLFLWNWDHGKAHWLVNWNQ